MLLKLAAKMPLPLKPVQLRLKKLSLCIDKTSGLKNGVPIVLQACGGKNINQRFKLEKKRGDDIQIQSAHSGKCLGVADASKKPGASIQQWSCLRYDNQLWKKIDYAHGWFALKAKHSGLCLTAISNKNARRKAFAVIQRECRGSKSAKQQFKITR